MELFKAGTSAGGLTEIRKDDSARWLPLARSWFALSSLFSIDLAVLWKKQNRVWSPCVNGPMSTTEDISTEQQQTTERAAKYFDKNKLSRPAAAFDPTEVIGRTIMMHRLRLISRRCPQRRQKTFARDIQLILRAAYKPAAKTKQMHLLAAGLLPGLMRSLRA